MATQPNANLQPYQALLIDLIDTAFMLLRNLVAIVVFGMIVTMIGLENALFSPIIIIMSLMLAVYAYLRVKSVIPPGYSGAMVHLPSIVVSTVTVFSAILMSNFARQLAFQLMG